MKPKVIITIVIGTVIALLLLIIFQNSVPNEIAKMQKDLPMKIGDGMTLTEVYESGKTVFYVVVIDTEMSIGKTCKYHNMTLRKISKQSLLISSAKWDGI